MKRRHAVVFAIALFSMVISGRAFALCLAPLCACTVSSPSIAFPAYDPLAGGAVDSSGNVRVSCSGVAGLLIPYNIGLGSGNAPTASGRFLSSGAAKLIYNLYQDSTYTTIWGDGSNGGPVVNGGLLLDLLGLSPPINHRIHARIDGNQRFAIPGLYLDNIYLTVTYY